MDETEIVAAIEGALVAAFPNTLFQNTITVSDISNGQLNIELNSSTKPPTTSLPGITEDIFRNGDWQAYSNLPSKHPSNLKRKRQVSGSGGGVPCRGTHHERV